MTTRNRIVNINFDMTTRKRIIAFIFWLTASASCQTVASSTTYGGVSVDLGVTNASVVLLDPTSHILYVGARETVLALDPNSLSTVHTPIEWAVPEKEMKECKRKGKTETCHILFPEPSPLLLILLVNLNCHPGLNHMNKEECHNYICLLERLSDVIYVCGSYAFNPRCAFIDPVSFTLQRDGEGEVKMENGKGKCPYGPRKTHTAVTAGGELYSAAPTNFLGTEFDIARVTGGREVNLEKSANFLNDPEFVGSVLIRSAAEDEDDHIYWFFTENAKEFSFYQPVRISRVARTCTGDLGGSKTLQKRWTSFLKAPLVCKEEGGGRRYDDLTHLYPLEHRPGDPDSTHFYGLFTSQWGGERVSAVCVYSVSAVAKVMLTGRFADVKSQCKSSAEADPPSGSRPGQCITPELRSQGINSSLKLPDQLLTFTKDHPLLLDAVEAAPLLIRRGITYTSLAVSNVTGTRAAVIHLATGHGELHTVSVSGRSVSLLQEIPLDTTQPVNNIITSQDYVLALSASSVYRVPVTDCSTYASCQACARARVLGCVWQASLRVCGTASDMPGSSESRDSDVNPLNQCGTGEDGCSPKPEELHVWLGLTVVLSCQAPLSPGLSALCLVPPCGPVLPPAPSGSLELRVTSSSEGLYSCRCPARGEPSLGSQSCLTASYQLVLEEPRFGGRADRSTGRAPVGVYLKFVLLGALLGALVTVLLKYRQGWRTILAQGRHGRGQEATNESQSGRSPNSYGNEAAGQSQAGVI